MFFNPSFKGGARAITEEEGKGFHLCFMVKAQHAPVISLMTQQALETMAKN